MKKVIFLGVLLGLALIWFVFFRNPDKSEESQIEQLRTENNELKQKFTELTEEQIDNRVAKFMNEYIDDFIEAITRIAYTLIYTANDKIKSYDEFLRSIKKLKIDDDWIVEVTELAVDCFC